MSRVIFRFGRYLMLTPILGAVGLGVLWMLGLISFVITILVMTPASTVIKSDGIVVLTGGSGRVRAGLELLRSGQGRELLISGVHRGTDLHDLMTNAGMTGAKLPCCITLGFQAVDTASNARETAAWVKNRRVTRLRLVTANYHMPRAFLEMKTALPNVTIIAHPIRPMQFDWTNITGIKLIFEEYHKTLLIGARLGARTLRIQLDGLMRS